MNLKGELGDRAWRWVSHYPEDLSNQNNTIESVFSNCQIQIAEDMKNIFKMYQYLKFLQ